MSDPTIQDNTTRNKYDKIDIEMIAFPDQDGCQSSFRLLYIVSCVLCKINIKISICESSDVKFSAQNYKVICAGGLDLPTVFCIISEIAFSYDMDEARDTAKTYDSLACDIARTNES